MTPVPAVAGDKKGGANKGDENKLNKLKKSYNLLLLNTLFLIQTFEPSFFSQKSVCHKIGSNTVYIYIFYRGE